MYISTVKKILLCAISFCLFFSNQAQSVNIYISTKGNDLNDGSLKKPLASLNGAKNRIRNLKAKNSRQNIIVNLSAGNYFIKEPLVLNSEDGGAVNTTVTYKGAGMNKTIINGARQLTGFQKRFDGIWQLFIPEVKNGKWFFEDFYVNGTRSTRAKWPNDGFYRPTVVTENVLKKGTGTLAELARQTITITPQQKALLDIVPDNQLGDVYLSFYHKWDFTKKRLISYDRAAGQVTIEGSSMIPWNSIDSKTLFTIENFRTALDEPGEWFLDKQSGYLYYYPHADENITTAQCYVPVSSQFLRVEGTKNAPVQNIRFENLSFSYSSFSTPPNGVEPQLAVLIDAVIMADYATGIIFENCEVSQTGTYGMWFRKSCNNFKISHCHLHDLGAGGIKIGEMNHDPQVANTTNITVDNCIVQNGGNTLPCGEGIRIFTASNCTITHNDVADFYYTGIPIGWFGNYKDGIGTNNLIAFNHVHHLGWNVLSDLGGIYTLGLATGTTITNNVVHDISSYDYGGWGLYADEGSRNGIMKNNIVYNCKSAGFHSHVGKNNLVKNNIFYNQMIAQIESNSGDTPDGFRFFNNIISFSRGRLTNIEWDKNKLVADSNIYWDSRRTPFTIGEKNWQQWQQMGQDVHSFIADPQFANPASINFSVGNKTLMNKIDFIPFDYQSAGVYGTNSWKKEAMLATSLTDKFQRITSLQ